MMAGLLIIGGHGSPAAVAGRQQQQQLSGQWHACRIQLAIVGGAGKSFLFPCWIGTSVHCHVAQPGGQGFTVVDERLFLCIRRAHYRDEAVAVGRARRVCLCVCLVYMCGTQMRSAPASLL